MIKVNFLELWKLTKTCKISKGHLFKKKWLNLSKNSKLCGSLLLSTALW